MNNLTRAEPIYTAVTPETLDALWYEAEQLGQVRVDQSIIKGSAYEVQIIFKRKSGTRIYAQGTDTNIAVALSKAINEAREMDAGVAQ